MYTNARTGLWRVRDIGGEPEQVPGTEGLELRWLALLPDERTLLATEYVGDQDPMVVALNLETGERTVLIDGVMPRFVASGHVVFWRQDALWAAHLDDERLTLGPPPQVVENLGVNTNDPAWFAVGGDVLFYQLLTGASLSQGFADDRELVLVDRQGVERPLNLDPSAYTFPRVSPDGARLLFAIVDADNNDLWVFDLARESRSRITFGGNNRFITCVDLRGRSNCIRRCHVASECHLDSRGRR